MAITQRASIHESATATKMRLLDVSGRLFAENGFDSVSLRLITEHADANLAAVNYHFGSKEELIAAVVEKLVGPVNQRRLTLLRQINVDGSEACQSIVGAFIDPVIEAASRGDEEDQMYCKLMSRCIASRDERVTSLVLRQFPEVLAKFVDALRLACPWISSDAAHMRILFMAGAMAHALFHHDKLVIISEGRCNISSLVSLRDELVHFISAGMLAGISK
ncbi:MAG: TetR/AcrR family transcriptional regulator [Verrucomicrobiota bacterium]|nr:TetR/AcrR family transcriptional regulator [Verrucomicrobiota bacterium]